jgi:hypothetical protein
MIYAKMIGAINVSDRQTVVCGDRFDFYIEHSVRNEPPRYMMSIQRGNNVEHVERTGTVWVMNESGKTLSQHELPQNPHVAVEQ